MSYVINIKWFNDLTVITNNQQYDEINDNSLFRINIDLNLYKICYLHFIFVRFAGDLI